MRRVAVLVCFVLALAAGSVRPASAQGTESISSYRVSIGIERSGRIRVVETIDYDFGTQQRHGIFRTIPVRYRYDDTYDRRYRLHVESVTASAGTPAQLRTEQSGGSVAIRIGDPDETITGRHRYTITYTVDGVLNAFEDHDELYWNAIGAEWDVPIAAASATVTAPSAATRVACFAGPRGSNLPCAGATIGVDGSAQFSGGPLGPREAFTIVVALPKGVVIEPAPILDERWSLDRAFSRSPATVGGSAVLLAGVLAGVGWLGWRRGRDVRFAGSPVDVAFGNDTGAQEPVPLLGRDEVPVQFEPPDGLRPGQVGTLVDEVANPLDVTATIVDLAVRGYLRIAEIERKGWFAKPDWRLVRLDKPTDELLAYERTLLSSLFAGGGDVQLSELKNTFAPELRRVQDALYADAVREGWFSRRPDRVRLLWVGIGAGALAAAVAVTVVLAAFTHAALLGVPLVAGALALLAASKRMPRRTAKGTAVLQRTLGFRRFIEESEKERAQFAERANLFSEYLPYAIVFGATEKWAKAFEGLDDEVLASSQSWYVGQHTFTTLAFADAMDGFSTTTAGTLVSTPAGSGMSGFGGGGFSGGGGGGGGGGSW